MALCHFFLFFIIDKKFCSRYINKCSHTKAFGRVAKLVDALDLGSSAFGVRVRVSSRPYKKKELGFSLVLSFCLRFRKETRTQQGVALPEFERE